MKIVHENQTKEFKNGDTCIATEYPLGDKEIDMALVEVSDRYPKKGRATNEKCKELAYIVEGSGKVVVEDKEVYFHEKDMLLIEPGEKVYWEGNFKMFVSCTPAWYSQQHKKIE